MNIYEKMSAITAELTAVAKNLQVGEGKSSYKAVGEADVLAAVKPLEVKHKVYSYPFARRVIDTDTMTTVSEYNGNKKETNKLFLRIETVYRFVNIENPEEYIDITTYGDGVDSQDKAVGKAMTYADKYALMKAYKIITGEDPDQNKSEEGTFNKAAQKPVTKTQQNILMELCGKFNVDIRKLGKAVGATSLATMTQEQNGQALHLLKKIENGEPNEYAKEV